MSRFGPLLSSLLLPFQFSFLMPFPSRHGCVQEGHLRQISCPSHRPKGFRRTSLLYLYSFCATAGSQPCRRSLESVISFRFHDMSVVLDTFRSWICGLCGFACVVVYSTPFFRRRQFRVGGNGRGGRCMYLVDYVVYMVSSIENEHAPDIFASACIPDSSFQHADGRYLV